MTSDCVVFRIVRVTLLYRNPIKSLADVKIRRDKGLLNGGIYGDEQLFPARCTHIAYTIDWERRRSSVIYSRKLVVVVVEGIYKPRLLFLSSSTTPLLIAFLSSVKGGGVASTPPWSVNIGDPVTAPRKNHLITTPPSSPKRRSSTRRPRWKIDVYARLFTIIQYIRQRKIEYCLIA